ncbi:MAG: hypothetical protein ACKVWR_09370 [Acidimicrobiales bacterium]
MTPTLSGRIQTRLVLLAVLGLPWTIVVTPFLPRPAGGGLGALYATTLAALILVAVLGAALWEPLYHLLQQCRWEKDWPTLFGLLVGFPESLLAWAALRAVGPSPETPAANALTFGVHFWTTWLLVWLAALGPLRVVLLRWRYRGGRIF